MVKKLQFYRQRENLVHSWKKNRTVQPMTKNDLPKSSQTGCKNEPEGSNSMSPCFSHVRGKSDSRPSCHTDLFIHSNFTAENRSSLGRLRLCFFCKFTWLKENLMSVKRWRSEDEGKCCINAWLTGTATWSLSIFCAMQVLSMSPHCFRCFLQQINTPWSMTED